MCYLNPWKILGEPIFITPQSVRVKICGKIIENSGISKKNECQICKMCDNE